MAFHKVVARVTASRKEKQGILRLLRAVAQMQTNQIKELQTDMEIPLHPCNEIHNWVETDRSKWN